MSGNHRASSCRSFGLRIPPLLLLLALIAPLAGCNEPRAESVFALDPFYRQEYFTQLQPSEADVLFVIDSSCSMEDEQAKLAANFPRFIEFFLERQLSFRLAVTTTNIGESEAAHGLDGRLAGEPPWITEDTPDLEAAFVDRALVGIDPGHGAEKGLSAAYAALAEPEPPDEDFVRPDAQLAVVIVSDEPDTSERLEEPGHEDWISWETLSSFLDGMKGPGLQRMTQLSAIVGIGPEGFEDPNGCGGDFNSGNGALRGSGYLEAADATGGLWLSICEEDWGNMLARVGLAAAGLADSFALGEIPAPDTIEVRVEGDLNDRWEYRAFDNSVVFHDAGSVPEPGERLAISYQVFEGGDSP